MNLKDCSTTCAKCQSSSEWKEKRFLLDWADREGFLKNVAFKPSEEG